MNFGAQLVVPQQEHRSLTETNGKCFVEFDVSLIAVNMAKMSQAPIRTRRNPNR